MNNLNEIPPAIKLESRPCPLGCIEGDKTLFSARDRISNLPGIYSVVKCCGCGLVRTNPRPTPETIGFYYRDDYGPYLGTKLDLDSKSLSPIKRLVQRIFVTHAHALPNMPIGRMLEIGCASGSFLYDMASKGWEAKGIEFSTSAVESCRRLGLDVQQSSLESALPPAQRFDLIVGWMVMEHLHEPLVGLKLLNEWANPDSWLVFSVPNADSIDFKFRDCGFGIQLPCHLYHYTPKTITKILEISGWRVVKILHQRSSTSLMRSISYKLQDKGLKSLSRFFYKLGEGRSSLLLYPISLLLSLFGQTGRMTIWARKVN